MYIHLLRMRGFIFVHAQTLMQGASDTDALLRPSPELADIMCDTAGFISRYQWVWDVQMTKFFQMQHWNRIPSEWWGPLLQLNTEQLNQLPFGFTEPSWPQSLRTFVSGSQSVCLDRAVPDWVSARAVPVGGVCARKMTPKKAHEVSRMAGVVAEVCRNTGCSIVLDIGSGLGYLGGVLRQMCGLKVVGVEREGERVAAARRRAPSVFSTVQLDISDSHHCQTQLSSLLDDIIREEGGGRVCLVGLHCCGDLTPNILRMVSGQVHPDLCATVVVSCCYHKMSSRDSDVGFNCFPISAHLRDSCPDLCEKMSVFGLRLASQETRARWRGQTAEDHTHHQRNVSYRGILQAVCPELVGRLRINKSVASFQEFARDAATQLNNVELERDLMDYYSRHHVFASLIEPFTALQVCMQGAMETLLLADRLTFLREHGLSPVLLPLFDDLVSPRNIAIVTTLPGKTICEHLYNMAQYQVELGGMEWNPL